MPNIDEDGLDPTAAGFFAKELDRPAAHAQTQKTTPWEKWAHATALAKTGEFEPVRTLFDLYDAEPYDPLLNRACAEVLGLAGDAWCVEQARRELVAPDKPWHYELHIDLSLCLAYCGEVRDALIVLDAYKRLSSIEDAAAMLVFIRMILGDDGDEILFPDSAEEFDAYEEAVRRRFDRVVADVGGERVRVFEGRSFTPRRFTERFIAAVRDEAEISPRWRLRFEALSGIDCRHFYRRGRFQRIAALATLEKFMDSAATGLDDTRRRFFGHLIP